MPPKGEQKKRNKAQIPDKKRQGKKQTAVSFTAVTRLIPTTPIPPLTVLTSQPELQAGKKWCFEDLTPVYCTPDEPWPSTRLSRGTIVELTGQNQSVSAGGIKTSWSEIAYQIQNAQVGLQWVIGWINDVYLDDYKERVSDSGVVVPNPTPDPRDAHQYMVWEGKVRHNLCGEFCVAFIVNDDIDSVLTKWREHSESLYNRILGAGRDETTSVNDLKGMLGAILGDYGYDSDNDRLTYLNETLTYPVNPTKLLEDLQKMLRTHYLISGVMINIYSGGELVRKDSPVRTGHWVVLDKITRNGNRFEIYNPFPNRREEYSFTEFYNSFSTNSGLWVKRKKAHPASLVEDFPKFEVAIGNPNPAYTAAQYIDVDGKKKTRLCGEFCVAFILKESINVVLKRWKETQPVLYATVVGGNLGTGTAHLETILRAYGYNTEGDFTGFTKGLTDPFLKKCLISPGRIAKMLKTHFLIAGVNIDGRTGRLKRGNDVPHWVVLDKLTPVGKNMGWLEIYNPFQNYWEEYSYREFTNAIVDGYWSGLWVKRSIVPVYIPQVVVVSNTEDQPWKDVRTRQWTEPQLDGVIRQKVRSGKSVKKIAAELAELSGWKLYVILKKLKSIQAGRSTIWTDAKLREEIRRQLRNGKSIKKISADKLVRLSSWRRQDVKTVLTEMSRSEKWTEQKLLEAIRAKLKAIKSENKIAAQLFEGSGWRKSEIISRVKKVKEANRWAEGQLSREIDNRLENGRLKDKILTKLVEMSGWKRQEVRRVLKTVIAARKWTGSQLLGALRIKIKTAKSAEKAAAEVLKLSGWNRREFRELIGTQKWTEDRVRHEIEQQLNTGRSIAKIATELAVISGWRMSALNGIFKAIKEAARAAKNKKQVIVEKELVIIIDPATIEYASKPRADFVKWQDSLLRVPGSRLYRVRKWGDPVMLRYGFDVNKVNTTNFQAVGLYNDGNKEFGAVSNFIRISHEEVMRLKAMQIEDSYMSKVKDWRSQKMNWLCKPRGTIYFFDDPSDVWQTAPQIHWGTLALGGNLVQVVETRIIRAKMRDGTKRDVEMALLQGFTASDWGRPLDDLLAEGLVHRCFCAYKNNNFGDSPKEIVYSPFYSPRGRDFAGLAEANALYTPTEWLEPKNP